MGETHTGSSLTDFLRHDPKDRDNLNHDFDNDVPHGRRRSDLYVRFKPLEKVFHTAKQVDESIFAFPDILNSLRGKKKSQTYTFANSRNKEDAHLQKDSDPCEYRIRRWEYLYSHTSERPRKILRLGIYHTCPVSEGRGECKQDINGGIQPFCPFFIGTLGLIKGLYLGSKNSENGARRVAQLELGG